MWIKFNCVGYIDRRGARELEAARVIAQERADLELLDTFNRRVSENVKRRADGKKLEAVARYCGRPEVRAAALALVMLVTLSGCAVLQDRETLTEEAVFAAAHLVDGMETAQIHSTPGIIEEESAWAIGKKPSPRSVAIYFAGCETLHLAASDFMLEHHWPRLAIRTFEALTIADAGEDAVSNAYLGLKVRF